jgi:serine/threonine-protein kinase
MIPEKINRYEIKRELGRGGMASVYEAYDPQFQRPVAVKLLPREFLHDPEFRARFTREARTIASLEHPSIVPVYDFGEENGQPFLVMRLMTGGSLTDRLVQGPIAIEQAAEILKRIGSALDRAHSLGIIHRDLKPGNILFDHYGDAFLADFGIARITSSSSQLTASGSLVGTPTYMSPEQVYGNKELDGRADIYALGVILYQMLTGDVPYAADTPARMMMAHVMDPVPHLLDKRPDLAPADAVITKAMAKERDDRYPTASEMSNVLTEITKKMQQPDFTAAPPPTKAATPAIIPPPVETAATEALAATPEPDVAVVEPAPTVKPRPTLPPPPSFEEPAYSDELAAPATGASKTPTWVLLLLGGIVVLCLAGTVGGGFLVANQLGKEDEAATAVANLTPTTDSVFNTLTTDTPAPPTAVPPTATDPSATPTSTSEPSETATAPADPALATRESLAATRAAEAGNQGNNSNGGDPDVLATRQSLEATRAAESLLAPPDLFGDLDLDSALFSQSEGELVHVPDNEFLETLYIDETMADFVLDVTLVNPFDTGTGIWDFGVLFRQAEANDELRLYVGSNGYWGLYDRQGDTDVFVQEGDVTDILDVRPDEANRLTLIASGDRGFFFLNEQFVSVLDLTGRTDAGNLGLSTGFYEDEQEGATTAFENFGVWELSPDYGPELGELEHALDDVIKLAESGVNRRNVMITADFLNPFGAETNAWDIGFSFRDYDDGTKYWLVLDSAGEWELVGRYGDADSDTTLQSGEISNVDDSEDGRNNLTVIVIGETGFFFVNGEFVEQLELFDITEAGDVEILTAFYFDHEIEGEATGYDSFTVWPLP